MSLARSRHAPPLQVVRRSKCGDIKHYERYLHTDVSGVTCTSYMLGHAHTVCLRAFI